METFDITQIIEQYAPDTDELSKLLFPHVKYPKQAFDRVLKGEANLDTAQVCALAKYLGVLVSDLFTADGWKASYDKTNSCLTFVRGTYRVNLNYKGTFITVYNDGKMINQVMRHTTDEMGITDFIQYINNLIKNN